MSRDKGPHMEQTGLAMAAHAANYGVDDTVCSNKRHGMVPTNPTSLNGKSNGQSTEANCLIAEALSHVRSSLQAAQGPAPYRRCQSLSQPSLLPIVAASPAGFEKGAGLHECQSPAMNSDILKQQQVAHLKKLMLLPMT